MDIKSKKELDLFVSSLIENQDIKDKGNVFLSLRESILQILINQGEILPVNYLKLFFVFKDIDVKSHSEYSKHIDFFKKYYNNTSSLEEKFIINNFIFALEILNGNFKSVKDYIKRGAVLNFSKVVIGKEETAFVDFVKDEKIGEEIIIEAFKELIEPTNFLSISKEERHSIFVSALAIFWNNPNAYACEIWLTVFDNLVELLNVMIENELIEEQMYIHFFTYHIYGNNIQTMDEWRQFNKLVEKPASIFYKKWGEKHKLPKINRPISNGKKRIGFLIDRIVRNSPFMVFYSLVRSLLKSKEFNKNYEIYVYSMNYINKQPDDENAVNALVELGIKFFSPYEFFIDKGYYYSHLQKAIVLRERIIEDKIDFLIGGGGYDIPNFIFSTRTAPRQIIWSHGNCTSDLEEIDERISHFPQECKEWDWKIFNVPILKEFLVGSKDEKEKGLKIKKEYLEQFGKDTVILGTIGRLVKVDSDEYLKTIAKIMKQNPNAIYLACGAGNVESIKKKIKKYEIDEKRFIFTGHVNAHVYGWVIDIWINTFPLVQGQSQEEYYTKKSGMVIYGLYSFKCKDYSSHYEFIKSSHLYNPEREKLFLKVYDIKKEDINEDINFYDLRFNLYKKLNPNANFQEIKKCVDKLKTICNCKDRWFEYVKHLIQNRYFYEMEKELTYRFWKIDTALKATGDSFIKILEAMK